MTQNVSIGINAQPDQAIEAFRKITEEAKRLGVEVKNISSMDMFPGLEDAKRLLREINTGFEQMFSRAISGQAAGELRTGAKNGIYGKDVVSWMGGVQNQFPDQKELVRHLKDVISQASRISAFGSNAGAHIPQNGTPPAYSTQTGHPFHGKLDSHST